jgi:tetratricopeptide (TPR) repeat protein
VARRGARALSSESTKSASEIWRQTVEESGKERWEPEEVWLQETEQAPAGKPKKAAWSGPRDLATGKEGIPLPGGRRRNVPRPVVEELAKTAGAARGPKLAQRIADATYAYEKERYEDARRVLRPLAEEAPASPAVRELYGLVLYRLGRWAAAAKHLEAFRSLTGSFDQHPVLADCYRALRRFDDAEGVWEELREASPSGDLVAEGRIVAAGCLADQGNLPGAIAVLERSARKVSKPAQRHLRQWYALADLYERAGDVPRARDLFARIFSVDPDLFDVRVRLGSLR